MKLRPIKKTLEKEAPGRLAADRLADRDCLLHERAVLCARLARLLRRSLSGFDWAEVRFADRARLERILSGLGGDIPLVWLIEGQEYVEGAQALAQNKKALEQAKKALQRGRTKARQEPW